jgi:hypothetical protein
VERSGDGICRAGRDEDKDVSDRTQSVDSPLMPSRRYNIHDVQHYIYEYRSRVYSCSLPDSACRSGGLHRPNIDLVQIIQLIRP